MVLDKGESWIKGWEGKYSVDVEGNVYSYARGSRYLLSPRWNKSKSRWVVSLFENDQYFTEEVHRLVAESFLENPQGHKVVEFKDGDPSNCSACNLRWKASPIDSIPEGCEWVEEFEGLYYTNGASVFNKNGAPLKVRDRNGYLYYSLYRNGRQHSVGFKSIMRNFLES